MRAALLTAPNAPLEIVDDLDIEDPRAGEVLVAVKFCGICHSDITVQESGHALPAVLGHEAAGIVEAVGSGVTHLQRGDHVVLTPLAPCGHCPACARHEATACPDALSFAHNSRPDGTSPFSRHGAPVLRGLGVGGFATQTVVSANGAVKIAPDVPLEVACVIGCALQTGVGAVFNTAAVERGSSVLVMGLGGIGQAIVQGAMIAGASNIIVSDPVESRRETASAFGATHMVDPTSDDLAAAVADATAGQGVDYAFEAAGRAALVEQGIESTRVGGTTVMVGASPIEEKRDDQRGRSLHDHAEETRGESSRPLLARSRHPAAPRPLSSRSTRYRLDDQPPTRSLRRQRGNSSASRSRRHPHGPRYQRLTAAISASTTGPIGGAGVIPSGSRVNETSVPSRDGGPTATASCPTAGGSPTTISSNPT